MHSFMRIIIPAKQAFITGRGKPQINEGLRRAPGRGIDITIQTACIIKECSNFGPNEADFAEEPAGSQPLDDRFVPYQKAARRRRRSDNIEETVGRRVAQGLGIFPDAAQRLVIHRALRIKIKPGPNEPIQQWLQGGNYPIKARLDQDANTANYRHAERDRQPA
jgi:hypothetical protein